MRAYLRDGSATALLDRALTGSWPLRSSLHDGVSAARHRSSHSRGGRGEEGEPMSAKTDRTASFGRLDSTWSSALPLSAPRAPGERELLRPSPFVPLPPVRSPGAYERWVKPALDRLLAGLGLLVLAPVMLLVAAAVLCTLGRPVILRQERVGQHGRVFRVHKFRTMHHSRRLPRDRRCSAVGPGASPAERRAAADRRVVHKHPDDPRLVPLGRFLRRWSLDELPQFLDVLRGDMSLVGPRPELVTIVARYEPWQHRRHVVRPGITGPWQVGDRGGGGRQMHESTDIDLQYVNRVSFGQDLKLLLLTVPAALGRHRGF